MNLLKKLKAYFSSKRKLLEKLEALQNSKECVAPSVTLINKQKEAEDIWHLIVNEEGQETWVRPKHVTYVGPIKKNEFEFIIDGNKVSFSAKTIEELKQTKNIILNIESIPTANTYDTSKEASDYLDQLKLKPTKKITQQDIDAIEIKNKTPAKKSFFKKLFKKA